VLLSFGWDKIDFLKLTNFAYSKRSLKTAVNVFDTDSAVLMFRDMWSIEGHKKGLINWFFYLNSLH